MFAKFFLIYGLYFFSFERAFAIDNLCAFELGRANSKEVGRAGYQLRKFFDSKENPFGSLAETFFYHLGYKTKDKTLKTMIDVLETLSRTQRERFFQAMSRASTTQAKKIVLQMRTQIQEQNGFFFTDPELWVNQVTDQLKLGAREIRRLQQLGAQYTEADLIRYLRFYLHENETISESVKIAFRTMNDVQKGRWVELVAVNPDASAVLSYLESYFTAVDEGTPVTELMYQYFDGFRWQYTASLFKSEFLNSSNPLKPLNTYFKRMSSDILYFLPHFRQYNFQSELAEHIATQLFDLGKTKPELLRMILQRLTEWPSTYRGQFGKLFFSRKQYSDPLKEIIEEANNPQEFFKLNPVQIADETGKIILQKIEEMVNTPLSVIRFEDFLYFKVEDDPQMVPLAMKVLEEGKGHSFYRPDGPDAKRFSDEDISQHALDYLINARTKRKEIDAFLRELRKKRQDWSEATLYRLDSILLERRIVPPVFKDLIPFLSRQPERYEVILNLILANDALQLKNLLLLDESDFKVFHEALIREAHAVGPDAWLDNFLFKLMASELYVYPLTENAFKFVVDLNLLGPRVSHLLNSCRDKPN